MRSLWNDRACWDRSIAMCTRVAALAVCSLLSMSGVVLIGCTPQAYRTALPASCGTVNCGDAPDTFIEQHDGFDLAFVEFTERGYVFDRERMNQVLDYVAEQARHDPSDPDRAFSRWCSCTAGSTTPLPTMKTSRVSRASWRSPQVAQGLRPKSTTRRVIGVYVGWRGLSIDFTIFNNISYWDRKAAAEQVATGGVHGVDIASRTGSHR